MPSTSENRVLPLVIIAFGFIAGYFFASGSDPAAGVAPLESKYQVSALQSLRDARIDTAILSSTVFRSLRVFGTMPVIPNAEGKRSLFE
ncbi:MAG: hypothetical protein KBC02_02960 [Candidatus Pacebacteria bacterium]|nr:hypothetical protein [Candidatus Paceibacterota bacterium]